MKPKKVYNLSDGAFINGAIPKKSDSVTLKKIDKEKYIQNIVNNFKIDNIKLLNYSGFLKLYKNKIIELLDQHPKNKQELTDIIDLINDYTLAFLNYEPAVGILMRGSIWHILNAIYIALHKCSLEDYQKMVEIIKKDIENYQL